MMRKLIKFGVKLTEAFDKLDLKLVYNLIEEFAEMIST